MTGDEFKEFEVQVRLMLKTPEGRDGLLRAMRANPVSKEELKEIEAKLARKHGKSMTDVLIECIQSGELSELEIADAMEMLEGASKLAV